jgi:hypothetical protein
MSVIKLSPRPLVTQTLESPVASLTGWSMSDLADDADEDVVASVIVAAQSVMMVRIRSKTMD